MTLVREQRAVEGAFAEPVRLSWQAFSLVFRSGS
jgi:hypothetical protein